MSSFKIASSETIAASGSYISSPVMMNYAVSGFAIYIEMTGDGSIDIFKYMSIDGANYIKDERAIKRGFTKTSGPGGDGKDILYVSNIASDALKISFENTDSSNGVVVSADLSTRVGSFGDSPVYDGMTNAIRIIDYAHHEVHESSAYRSGMNYTLANGNVAIFV